MLFCKIEEMPTQFIFSSKLDKNTHIAQLRLISFVLIQSNKILTASGVFKLNNEPLIIFWSKIKNNTCALSLLTSNTHTHIIHTLYI